MASLGKAILELATDNKKFDSGIDAAKHKLGQLSKVGVMAGAAAVAASAVAVGRGVQLAGDLEQSVANISTIKPEIDTSKVFSALNEMQRRVPQSAEQLGDALYNVFSSIDVTAEEGLKLVEKFAKGAVGASTDAQTFGTAALGVMNAYKLSVKDADHISDVFFNTVNLGVVTGQELASSLGPVTSSARAAGVSLDELGALIVGVTKQGGPAAQNINDLNNVLMKITTKEAQADIEKLGVKTKTAAGDFRPIIDVFGDLEKRMSTMTKSQRAMAMQEIFPDAQARTGASKIMSELVNVNNALKANQTVVGASGDAYDKMSKTFKAQSAILSNTFNSILTTVGAKLLPAITPLLAAFSLWLPGALADAEKAFDRIGPVIGNVFGAIKKAADVVFPPLIAVIKFLADNWDAVAFSIKAMLLVALPAFVGFQAAAILTAVTTLIAWAPLILAIAAIGIAAFLLYKIWNSNMGGIQQAAAKMGEIVSAVFNGLKGLAMFVFRAIYTVISTYINAVLGVLNFFIDRYNGVARVLGMPVIGRIELTLPNFDDVENRLDSLTRDRTARVFTNVYEQAIAGGGGVNMYARGTDHITRGPEMFIAGEAGPERVQVTPRGEGGGVTVAPAITLNYSGEGGAGTAARLAQDVVDITTETLRQQVRRLGMVV